VLTDLRTAYRVEKQKRLQIYCHKRGTRVQNTRRGEEELQILENAVNQPSPLMNLGGNAGADLMALLNSGAGGQRIGANPGLKCGGGNMR
jgi:hypothetical protein